MPFTTSLTTSTVVQNTNAGGKQLVRNTLILKRLGYAWFLLMRFLLTWVFPIPKNSVNGGPPVLSTRYLSTYLVNIYILQSL